MLLLRVDLKVISSKLEPQYQMKFNIISRTPTLGSLNPLQGTQSAYSKPNQKGFDRVCIHRLDCFVVSQLFSVARHVRRFKLRLKPA